MPGPLDFLLKQLGGQFGPPVPDIAEMSHGQILDQRFAPHFSQEAPMFRDTEGLPHEGLHPKEDFPLLTVGDTIQGPWPGAGTVPNTGPTPSAAPYAWGNQTAPGIVPINPAPDAFQQWLATIRQRYGGQK